jgi:hypothetical protein
MSNKFNSKNESFVENEMVSKWLEPCKAHVAVIENVEYFKTNSGSDGLKFTIAGKPKEELKGKGQIAEMTKWLTDNAYKRTKQDVRVIMDKLGVREEFDSETDQVETGEEYAALIKKFAMRKPLAWLVGGEEVMIERDGEKRIWVKPIVYPFGFVAPIEELSKLEEKAMSLGGDKLLKRLDIAPSTNPTMSATQSADSSVELDW